MLSFLFGLVLVGSSVALDNGLGRKPGLGWNSDYCTNCSKSSAYATHGLLGGFQNEAFIAHIAKYMHDAPLAVASGKTFQQLGYNYVNMDASWNLPTRDANGDLMPDPAEWPSGLNTSIQYVHSLNLGFGLYGDRGTLDCAKNPGATGHEKQDAEFMARYKVDWYKEDSCYAPGDEATAIQQYAVMRDALNATGYPVWFALCGWKPWYASSPSGGNKLANSARIGPDTGTGWSAVLININNGLSVTNYTGPGFWNDGSLMLTPGFGKGSDNYMTNERHRAQFAAWAVMGMNILIVGNLSALNDYVITTWSNEEVLAVNQEPAGNAAVDLSNLVVSGSPSQDVPVSAVHYTHAQVQECGGEPDLQTWHYNAPAVGFLKNDKINMCLNVDSCATDIIYDGCNTYGTSCDSDNNTYFPNEMWTFTPSGQIKSALPGNKCVTVQSDHTVTVETCSSTATSQQWVWDPTSESGTIATKVGNLCITAGGSTPPTPPGGVVAVGHAIGAPGSAAGYYVMNPQPNATTITCGQPCFDAMGLTGTANVTVRDLWQHADVASVSPSQGFSVTVAGGGVSATYRFSRQ